VDAEMANRTEAKSKIRRRNTRSVATTEGGSAAREAGQTSQVTNAPDRPVSADRPVMTAPTRRDGARRAEQLAILSVAILVALVGFAFHPLWVVAIVLMALLWGIMASSLRSGRGSVLTEVVAAVVAEAKDVTDAASGRDLTDTGDRTQLDRSNPAENAGSDRHYHDRVATAKPNPPPEESDTDSDEVEPTKKDLYAEAREAGVEGRSTMSKDELKEALEE
jgi:hypothetical protein